MIVWGGIIQFGNDVNTGGRYCAESGPTPTPSSNTKGNTEAASNSARSTDAALKRRVKSD